MDRDRIHQKQVHCLLQQMYETQLCDTDAYAEHRAAVGAALSGMSSDDMLTELCTAKALSLNCSSCGSHIWQSPGPGCTEIQVAADVISDYLASPCRSLEASCDPYRDAFRMIGHVRNLASLEHGSDPSYAGVIMGIGRAMSAMPDRPWVADPQGHYDLRHDDAAAFRAPCDWAVDLAMKEDIRISLLVPVMGTIHDRLDVNHHIRPDVAFSTSAHGPAVERTWESLSKQCVVDCMGLGKRLGTELLAEDVVRNMVSHVRSMMPPQVAVTMGRSPLRPYTRIISAIAQGAMTPRCEYDAVANINDRVRSVLDDMPSQPSEELAYAGLLMASFLPATTWQNSKGLAAIQAWSSIPSPAIARMVPVVASNNPHVITLMHGPPSVPMATAARRAWAQRMYAHPTVALDELVTAPCSGTGNAISEHVLNTYATVMLMGGSSVQDLTQRRCQAGCAITPAWRVLMVGLACMTGRAEDQSTVAQHPGLGCAAIVDAMPHLPAPRQLPGPWQPLVAQAVKQCLASNISATISPTWITRFSPEDVMGILMDIPPGTARGSAGQCEVLTDLVDGLPTADALIANIALQPLLDTHGRGSESIRVVSPSIAAWAAAACDPRIRAWSMGHLLHAVASREDAEPQRMLLAVMADLPNQAASASILPPSRDG